MRLTKRDINTIQTYVAGRNQSIIEEFLNSDMECAEIEDYPHANVYSCTHSFQTTIKKGKYHGVKCIAYKGKPYLIKVK